MNKKNLAAIRKEFKMDNHRFQIDEICSVYVKQESKDIISSEKTLFARLDTEHQELLLKNFKRILTGPLDTKVYELDFISGNNEGQHLLLGILESHDLKADSDKLIEKILEQNNYETDVVINLIRAEYSKPAKKRKGEDDAGMDDVAYAFRFLMCSVNKVDQPKRALRYDFEKKGFKVSTPMDVIVNLSAPLDGFMFPCFNENSADVNRVIYYSQAPNCPNTAFVEGVIHCELKLTASEEKDKFSQIIKGVVGEKIQPEIMNNIYSKINEQILASEEEEESDIPTLGVKNIEWVLRNSGVEDISKLEQVFCEIMEKDSIELKATSILPPYESKSIKINSSIVDIAISPKDLKGLKQVVRDGRKCLLIEIDDDIIVEGLKLNTENY
ncbi:DUF4317 domain-containing protein [Desulforamulus ruminis]|uniref:DUF4317 family protein n=1 Tax=Desulforamulus ruminis (strain ATCC 23193 / DSM 2154 / NCIMB 8452 / DL) TaxID=696281 RepID=F6DVF6_DESRL|nr:DUF4317 domain-containing protein [Desulforamulus ruminis]AEG60309.1 hypothetical protein Desru_2056 [Desulforamulus ruminis DSM 2154]